MIISIYKSYYLALDMLNHQVYQNMAKDISTLNLNHPIKFYSSSAMHSHPPQGRVLENI